MQDLSDQLDRLDARIEALEERQEALEAKQGVYSGRDAARLLDQLADDPDAPIPNHQADLDAVLAELAPLYAARELLTRCLREQKEREQEAKVQAALPKHRETVRKVVEALCGVGRLLLEEERIRFDSGAATHVMRPMPFRYGHTLDVRRPDSLLACYIREAVRYGFLTGEEPFLEGVLWREGQTLPTSPVPPVKSGQFAPGYMGDFITRGA